MKRLLFCGLFLLIGASASADLVCSSNVQNVCGGGGGGATVITSGTTTISGGTDTHVCFNDGGVMSCGDAGLTYTKGTDKLAVAGTVELGHATDTTLSRSAAGLIAVEGKDVVDVSTADQAITARKVFGSAADAANAVDVNATAGCLTFEGSAADAIESMLCATNPTSGDQTFNLPNVGGGSTITLAGLNFNQTFTAQQTFGGNGFLGYSPVEAVTATKTTTLAEGLETYTNTGDTDGATITLLNDPTAGTAWNFAVTTAQTLTVVPSSGESLYMGTDQCNVSMTANAVGATVTIRAVVGGSGGVFVAFGASGWTCND